jgi:Fe-Mn family superoxide dismutase
MTTRRIYELPVLGFAYDALEPAYSAELLELHYSEHHRAYVDGANKCRHDLEQSRRKNDFDRINQLQKDLAFNLSGHVLHSIFWRNIAPDHGSTPAESLASQIRTAFGGFDALREQFWSAGAATQGSGWAALAWDPASHSLVIEQIYDHQDNVGSGTVPVLVMDMWEHAYYLQYRNEKKKWIKAFWGLINWPDIGDRLEKAKRLDLGLDPLKSKVA